jgi:hypothetical protein
MRTYGVDQSTGQWVEVLETSYIWLATLAQTLRLNQGESPFYANYGIPAQNSVYTQIPPDLAVNRTQTQYAPFFANLTVVKQQNTLNPTYNISAVFQNGTIISSTVAT